MFVFSLVQNQLLNLYTGKKTQKQYLLLTVKVDTVMLMTLCNTTVKCWTFSNYATFTYYILFT